MEARDCGMGRRTFALGALCLPAAGCVTTSSPGGSDLTDMQSINPPGSQIPGISQGILGSGNILFLSGHVPFDVRGEIVGPWLEEQMSQVFDNMGLTLQQAGASFAQLARITIYVRDYSVSMLPTIRAVRDRYVDAARPPASALIGVQSLFHPDVLVEIDGIALLAK